MSKAYVILLDINQLDVLVRLDKDVAVKKASELSSKYLINPTIIESNSILYFAVDYEGNSIEVVERELQ